MNCEYCPQPATHVVVIERYTYSLEGRQIEADTYYACLRDALRLQSSVSGATVHKINQAVPK